MNAVLEEKFVNILTEHKESFYRLAYSFVKNEQDALDAVGEAVYKALKKLHSVNEPEYLKTWFSRIIINECNMLIRRKKSMPLGQGEIEQLAAPLDGIDHEYMMDLYKSVDKLEEKYRTIIILRYARDLQFDEIAKIVEMNVNTVKTRHKRGLNKLKKLMGGHYHE